MISSIKLWIYNCSHEHAMHQCMSTLTDVFENVKFHMNIEEFMICVYFVLF